jgi:hypothetical protein
MHTQVRSRGRQNGQHQSFLTGITLQSLANSGRAQSMKEGSAAGLDRVETVLIKNVTVWGFGFVDQKDPAIFNALSVYG